MMAHEAYLNTQAQHDDVYSSPRAVLPVSSDGSVGDRFCDVLFTGLRSFFAGRIFYLCDRGRDTFLIFVHLDGTVPVCT